MSTRCPLFVELCAGSAAVSLRLLGISRPPIAFMGAKTSLASTILRVMGLHPGQGAEAVVLVDAGPWGAAWQVLLDPAKAHAVAAVLRSWSQEDPRALWVRLAAVVPAQISAPDQVAQWLWLQGRSCNNVPVWPGVPTAPGWRMAEKRGGDKTPPVQRGEHPDHRGLRHPETVAERVETIAWLMGERYGSKQKPAKQSGTGAGQENGLRHPGTVADRVEDIARLVCADHATGRVQLAGQTCQDGIRPSSIAERIDALAWQMARKGGGTKVPEQAGLDSGPRTTETIAARVDAVGWWMATNGRIQPAAQRGTGAGEENGLRDPGTVANRIEALAAWLFRAGNSWRGEGVHWRNPGCQAEPGRCQITPGTLAERVSALVTGPVDFAAVLHQDVAELLPPAELPEGTVVYLDPPYLGRTGYGFDLPRPQVIEVARAWADAGALVCVSEAEPLDIPGWHHVEITSAMASRNKDWQRRREFLTLNHPPATRVEAPPRQTVLQEVEA